MSVADLKVRISANADQFDSAMKNMQKSFDRTVRKMERTGKNLTQKMTVPIGLMAAAAGAAAITFESAFTGVRKTVDATEAEFQRLRKGILEMSKELPTSANEIARVAEVAGQLGIQSESLLKFTKTMVMLGDTTNIVGEEGALALSRFMNVMGTADEDIDRIGSVIVDLGNNMAATEAEIVEIATSMAAFGQTLGLSESDVLAFSAAIAASGGKAEAASSAFQRIGLAMRDAAIRGGEELATFAEVAGQSVEEFTKTFETDAARAFSLFLQGLQKIKEAGLSTTPVLDQLGLNTVRLRREVGKVTGNMDDLNRALGIGEEAWKENNALTEEAQKRYDTVAAKLRMLGNRIFAIGVTIGDALMPFIEKAISFLEGLTKAFANLSSEAKANVLKIAALFAASGPIMWALAKFAKVIKGLAVLVKSRFAIIIASFAAGVGIGQWFVDNWDKLAAGFEMKMLTIEWAATNAIIGIIKAFTSLFHFVTELAPPELLANLFGVDLSTMAMDFLGVDKLLKNLNNNITSAGKDMKDAMKRFYEKPFTTFFESAKNGMGKISSTFIDFVGNLTKDTALADFLKTLEGGFKGVEKSAEDAAKSMAKFKEAQAKFGQIQTVRPDAMGVGSSLSVSDGRLEMVTGSVVGRANEMSKSLKAALGLLPAQIQKATAKMNELSGAGQVAMSIANQFTSSFGRGMANVIVQGEKLADVLGNIGKLLVSSVLQKGISLLLTGGISGVTGFFGSGGGLFGAIFGGLFADGGRPPMGRVSIVGERGPELFVPDRPGTIIPNHALSAGSSRSVTIIENIVNLDGKTIYRNQRKVERGYDR